MNLKELLREKQNIDKLEDIIQQICQEVAPVNQEASKDFAENLDTLVPPQQGLGKLRHMVMQYLSIAGIPAKLMPPVNFIFAVTTVYLQKMSVPTLPKPLSIWPLTTLSPKELPPMPLAILFRAK